MNLMRLPERINPDRGAPPWIVAQHLWRYRWACTFTAGKRVLDAACGTGYGSHMLATEGQAEFVLGLDLASDVIEENSKRYASQANLKFEVGDVCDLQLPAESFDVYTSFETIEHVPDPLKLLQEAKRILRPGGLLLLSTPNRELTNPGKTINDRPFNPFHLREWSVSELTELVGQVFPNYELFVQAPFPERYARFLAAIGRWSHWLGFRMHQLTKVLLTLVGRFPPCHVQPPIPTHPAEVSIIRACKG